MEKILQDSTVQLPFTDYSCFTSVKEVIATHNMPLFLILMFDLI